MTVADLHVRDTGAPGPAVVLLHSLFFDGGMFDDLLGELPDGMRYIRPDHRGQGGSPRGGAPLTMERLAKDVAALVDERACGPVHLVGSSMGAYVAIRVVLERPDLVASCCLLGCTADAEPDRERFDGLVDRLRRADADGLVDAIEHTMFGDDFLGRPLDDPVRARWRGRFGQFDRTVADAAEAVFSRSGVRDRLGEVRIPLLLIAGQQDHAKQPTDMEPFAEVPGSSFIVLPSAGHSPVVEEPASVARRLRSWWGTT